MSLEVGTVVEGKVSSIAKFGAFVALEGGKSGLVHISEIANSFVSDVSAVLHVGDTVKVRVMEISEDGKIKLSIKRAEERPAAARSERPAPRPGQNRFERSAPRPRTQENAPQGSVAEKSENQDFEDRLKKFMQESDRRIADNRLYADRGHKSRKR